MIQALPRETVFEAQERARQATRFLFVLVLFTYIAIFNLAALSCIWVYKFFNENHSVEILVYAKPAFLSSREILVTASVATLTAVILALIHFCVARTRPLDDLLQLLGAKNADPSDSYHAQFINIVEEAKTATGIQNIRPVIISDMGLNAFSLDNGKGEAAIGITEGLLGRLDRSELTAVVSHEAAHLVNEDSRLTTTLYSLTSIFAKLSNLFSNFQYLGRVRSSERSGGGIVIILLIQLVLWTLSSIGCALTKVLYLAISRNREYLADAHAAQMCKDPLSLAEALNKIACTSRGNFPTSEGLSTIFIMNPDPSYLDEASGALANWLSAHPPVKNRIARLVKWAKANFDSLPKNGKPAESGFYYKTENGWEETPEPEHLISQGVLTPQSWVSPLGTSEIGRVSDYSELVSVIKNQQVQNEKSMQGSCPRCKITQLVEMEYEGTRVLHCKFCKGSLLKEGILERLIVRREKLFGDSDLAKIKEIWLKSFGKNLKDSCPWPYIRCPICDGEMMKSFHALYTRVVIDRCLNCHAIWCDQGELEMIQMIIENPDFFVQPRVKHDI